jgi:hypothetical protein
MTEAKIAAPMEMPMMLPKNCVQNKGGGGGDANS